MRVEVCYALPDRQDIVSVELDSGATLFDAIQASGLARRHAIDLDRQRVGIFGKLKTLASPLQDGDRVEIYRPLTVHAKAARLRRAAKPRGGANNRGAGPRSR